MKTHFVKLVWRGIAKRPLIHSINFIGLALSMAVVIILAVYCFGEINANKFNKNIDNIYVICSEGFQNELQTNTPAILKGHIEEKIPEVEKVVRMRAPWGETTFQAGGGSPVSSNLIFADPSFADVFSFQCIAGDLKQALQTPMSIVLTDKEAHRMFGELSPIGETVKIDNNRSFTVKAVINGPKAKSSLSFNAIVPMASIGQISPNGDELTSWSMSNFTSFAIIKNTANIKDVENKICQLYPESKHETKISLQPFSSFYFSDVDISRVSFLRGGNKTTTTVLFAVAAIILIMGVINYLNLTFSMVGERLKNNGVLKVIGARKSHIARNIVGESVLFFFVSLMVAFFVSRVMMPVLASQIGIEIYPEIVHDPLFLLVALSSTLIVAAFLVSVPAIRLAAVSPVASINGKISGKMGGGHMRRALVVSQFTVAIILISFTWAVQKQVRFGKQQLGYDEENIYTVELSPRLKKEVLSEKLRQIAGVQEVTCTNYMPGKESIEHWFGMSFKYKGETKKGINSHIIRCDNKFPTVLGLEAIEGRLFSPDMSTDKNTIVVNKAFVDEYGLDEPLGIKIPAFMSGDMEIIGVVDNFHFQSVHKKISPAIIRVDDYAKYCYVKIASTNFNSLRQTVSQINETAMELSAGFPINSGFLDVSVAEMYKTEVQFRKIFFLFSVTAIFLCCLGILGLSILATQHKIKEIGIRKVNGARISEVMVMLNKDFVKWVAIAFIIATPIAWYAMHLWLENFAYKTTLSWWIFALAGVLALVIALLTVSFQSWKAATRNPVEALRYE